VQPQETGKLFVILSKDSEVVDAVREAGRVVLSRLEPLVVPSGQACLSVLGTHRAALLVLDDAVHRGGGPVLLYQIRTRCPRLPILYVASRHNTDLEREVREIGAFYYTAKPIDRQVLASLIASVMGLRVMRPDRKQAGG